MKTPGPRLPCSEEEREAIHALAARLGEGGYATAVEEFPSRPSAGPAHAAYAGLSAVAALLLYRAPLAAAVIGAAAIVLDAREAEGRPLVEGRTGTSCNAVARPPVPGPPRLVVIAHADAAGRRFSEVALRGLVLTLHVLMAGIPAAGAGAWVAEAGRELPATVGIAGTAAAVVVIVLAVLLYRPERDGPGPAPGGGPASLVAISDALSGEAVWFVATGSKDSGMIGIQAFLDVHGSEVAGAAWLNLESSAASGVVAVSEEGTWRERRADRALMGAAEEAGAEVRPYRAAPTDATALLARRRRALTLMAGPGDEAGAVAVARAVAAAALHPQG